MKFKSKIRINASKEEIVEKLTNMENMAKWMKGFQSYKLLKGEAFEVGSEAIIVIKVPGRKIEMKETILENDLPHSFKSKYEAEGVTNYVNNQFEEINEELTRWRQQQEFRFKSLAAKMFSSLVTSIFKAFSKSMLTDFKKFVEKEEN